MGPNNQFGGLQEGFFRSMKNKFFLNQYKGISFQSSLMAIIPDIIDGNSIWWKATVQSEKKKHFQKKWLTFENHSVFLTG